MPVNHCNGIMRRLKTSFPGCELSAVVALVIIGFGVYLRSAGLDGLQFWIDEARWAIFALDGEFRGLRPPAYMWLSQFIASYIPGEPGWRLLSWLSGVLTLPVFYLVLRQVFLNRWIAVFGLLVLAVHPAAIDMSREFKPYALELFLHVLMVLLALAYASRASFPALAAVISVAIFAPLFTWSIVFVYPGVFLVLGYVVWQRGQISHLAIVGLGAMASLVMLLALYFLHVQGYEGTHAGY